MKNNRKDVPAETMTSIKTLLKASGNTLEDIQVDNTSLQELLTIKETSVRLKCSIDTVKRRIRDGSLKAKKLKLARNGSVRILWSDVIEWLNKSDIEPGSIEK